MEVWLAVIIFGGLVSWCLRDVLNTVCTILEFFKKR